MEQHLLAEPEAGTLRLEILEGPTGRRLIPPESKGLRK